MNYLNNTEIVSVIGDFNSKKNQLQTLGDDVVKSRKDLIDYSRKILFPKHYGTNPMFLKSVTEDEKKELRTFLFPNHYTPEMKKTFYWNQ